MRQNLCCKQINTIERNFAKLGSSTEQKTLDKKTLDKKTRRSQRFPFIAVAEIAHAKSGGRLACRVAKLSLHGCYVDIPNTLAVGREVSIKIFCESECFAATARVVYELPNSGMGLSFEQVLSSSAELLQKWLLKANREEPAGL